MLAVGVRSAAAGPATDVTGVFAFEPASSGGLQALDRALVRLSTHRRLMVLAAHPDDEDTSLLTWVARGLGGEAAYLSLSRGEGGQNLIGPELGIGLGLLRSRELLAARRIDGARQYFSRAFDFGYTRSIDETFARWPKEVLLEDAVRVVRRFKPQVLVAVFPPTAAAGHGQHQASAIIADEVRALAAAPDVFPDLGPPWRIASLFRAAWWNPEGATHEIELGEIEPWSGRSILQLALESRSQHRCQDMGSLQPLGDASGRLIWVAGDEPAPEDLFGHLDVGLAAIADLLPAGDVRRELRRRLEQVAGLAQRARRDLGADQPGGAVDPLLEILRLLRAGRDLLPSAGAGAERHVAELLDEKLAIAREAIANAAQVLADAVTDRETVVAGGRLEVRAFFWNAGPLPVARPRIDVLADGGWRVLSNEAAEPERSRFSATVTDERRLTLDVPADAPPTVPYFLLRPLRGDLYDWSVAPAGVRGEPFGEPPVRVRFRFTLGGVEVELVREVVYRARDQAYGEVRRPLRVVPALELALDRQLLVWPTAGRRLDGLRVEVRSNVDEILRARLEVGVPDGWPEVPARELELGARGRTVVDVSLQGPAELVAGRHAIELAVIDDQDRRFDRAIQLVDYEHIPPTPVPVSARVEVSAGEIRLPELERVGYVRGASDRVPELLAEIGLPVELLGPEELAGDDLGRYDAVVIGSRAYETEAALAAVNGRLLDYVRDGGLLLVQYQQYPFVEGGYAPFPLAIARPHDRVTDEAAAVRILEPEHPVFQSPNRLGAADWDGWVQERGLYFAGTWDDAYHPLLAMADPEGDEKRGALLVAQLGDGHYVYTGLAFFRQLPAGVPGAYRLFANLLALGEPAEGDSPGARP